MLSGAFSPARNAPCAALASDGFSMNLSRNTSRRPMKRLLRANTSAVTEYIQVRREKLKSAAAAVPAAIWHEGAN